MKRPARWASDFSKAESLLDPSEDLVAERVLDKDKPTLDRSRL